MFGAGREEVLVESKSWFAAKPYDWLGLNSAAFGLSVEQRMDGLRIDQARSRSSEIAGRVGVVVVARGERGSVHVFALC